MALILIKCLGYLTGMTNLSIISYTFPLANPISQYKQQQKIIKMNRNYRENVYFVNESIDIYELFVMKIKITKITQDNTRQGVIVTGQKYKLRISKTRPRFHKRSLHKVLYETLHFNFNQFLYKFPILGSLSP